MKRAEALPFLNEFGEHVIHNVRDAAAKQLQNILAGTMADQHSKRLYEEIRVFDEQQVAIFCRFLLEAVDLTIAHFLGFIDQYEIGLRFHAKNGRTYDIREISDGLAGELWTEDGWIAKFSQINDATRDIP